MVIDLRRLNFSRMLVFVGCWENLAMADVLAKPPLAPRPMSGYFQICPNERGFCRGGVDRPLCYYWVAGYPVAV